MCRWFPAHAASSLVDLASNLSSAPSSQAVEHKRVDALSEDLPPGTKVRLASSVVVRTGVLMLEPGSLQVRRGLPRGTCLLSGETAVKQNLPRRLIFLKRLA